MEAAVSNVDVESDGHSGLIVLVAIIIGVGVWILRSGRCASAAREEPWPCSEAKRPAAANAAAATNRGSVRGVEKA